MVEALYILLRGGESLKLKYIAILLATILLATVAAWAANEYFKLPTSGYIETEYDITFNPTSIDWGNMSIGVPISYLVNITNTGTRNFTNLNVTCDDWSDNLIDFDLECNVLWEPLVINQSIIANFTLTIYEATQGDFTLDIYVSDVES